MRLLLASKSPVRLSTLLAAGITPIVRVSEVDEDVVPESIKTHSPSPSADDQVAILACVKRDTVASTFTSDVLLDEEGADSLLPVGCDSMLEISGRMVGKLRLPEIAREKIREVRGNTAALWAGHAVSPLRRQENGSYVPESTLSRPASTVVHFGQISDEEIEAYIASGEPLRVTGSFMIDGLSGPFITGVKGDHHSVVGISLSLLHELASELSVFWPDLWDFRRRTPSRGQRDRGQRRLFFDALRRRRDGELALDTNKCIPSVNRALTRANVEHCRAARHCAGKNTPYQTADEEHPRARMHETGSPSPGLRIRILHMDMTLTWGIGLVTVMMDDEALDVWYPYPHLGTIAPNEGVDLLETLTAMQDQDDTRQVRTTVVTCKVGLSDRPQSTADTYLRLHLLSHRLVKPSTTNLDDIVSRLPDVVWTVQGPCAAEGFEETRLRLRAALGHPVVVLSIDRFPIMVYCVAPEEMRVADGVKVRLGACLAEGASVMHAAFVSYNAGALERYTVEGRISQGIVIDGGSGVSGGVSTMSTLSDDGRNQVRPDKRCLLGTNSGLGTPLGDDCVIEAGLFLTAGTKVAMMKTSGVVSGAHGLFAEPSCVPTCTFAGASSVLFRRNSRSGRIETLSRGGKNIEIPEDASPHT